MEIRAYAKNIRMSPQKIRLVVDQIKKMRPTAALDILDLTPKAAAKPVKTVIKSAIFNAKNNFGQNEANLIFKEISVGKGRVFKKYQPVARRRAHPILNRMSHIRVVLEGKEKGGVHGTKG